MCSIVTKRQGWIDFSKKMIYLYENLFKGNEKMLVHSFTPNGLNSKKRAERTRTIKNWIDSEKKITRAKQFNLDDYPIKKYIITKTGEKLLPVEAFQYWSYKKFKSHVDNYLLLTEHKTIQEQMKYIYFYNFDTEMMESLYVSFADEEDTSSISIFSEEHDSSMRYTGKFYQAHELIYIEVRNNYNNAYYVFNDFSTRPSKEVREYGVAIGKEYTTSRSKAYMVLLCSSELSNEEKLKYSHKLNRSNHLVASNLSKNKKMCSNDFLVSNFIDKIRDLISDIGYEKDSDYGIYYQLALQIFTSYSQIANRMSNGEDYFIRNKKSLKIQIFTALSKKQSKGKVNMQTVDVLYALTPSNIKLLEIEKVDYSDLVSMQIDLVKNKKIKLNYLFVITNPKLLSNRLMDKLSLLSQEESILVKIVAVEQLFYEEIILPSDEPIVIYQTDNDFGNYVYVSKHNKTKTDIRRKYDILYANAKSLQDYLSVQFPLNGEWASYTLDSKLRKATLKIENHAIEGNFISLGKIRGRLQEYQEYTLMLFDRLVIKIHNSGVKEEIFRISIIGEERNVPGRDVLFFGVMTKKKLSDEQIKKILKSVNMSRNNNEGEDKDRLRISGKFDRELAGLDLSKSEYIASEL